MFVLEAGNLEKVRGLIIYFSTDDDFCLYSNEKEVNLVNCELKFYNYGISKLKKHSKNG